MRAILFLFSALLFLSGQALGDSLDSANWFGDTGVPTDPQVQVGRHRRGLPFAIVVSGLDFEFVDPLGSGSFNFLNANDLAFRTLTITITPGGPGNKGDLLFTCNSTSDSYLEPFFSNCSFLAKGDLSDPTQVRFSGGEGIGPRDYFSMDLKGFESGSQILVQATYSAVPEPASILMCLSGLAALALRRRK